MRPFMNGSAPPEAFRCSFAHNVHDNLDGGNLVALFSWALALSLIRLSPLAMIYPV